MRIKLVRDFSPASLRPTCNATDDPIIKSLALQAKLHEEAQEVIDHPHDPFEYADLIETLAAFAKLNKVTLDAIMKAMGEKREIVGAFNTFKIWVEDDDHD